MRWLVALALVGCGDNRAPGIAQDGSRLASVRYALATGGQVIDRERVHDRQRGEDCTIELFASGERHCMPVGSGGFTQFTDSLCTRVVGVVPFDEDVPRYFVRRFMLSGESLPSRLYPPVLSIEPPAALWRQQDGFCLPTTAVENATYYTVGEEIAASALARITVTETLVGDRLSLAVDGSGDGWRRPGQLVDNLLALPCSLDSAANTDVVRCVPDGLVTTTYFADATCSTPLVSEDRMLHTARDGCTSVVDAGGAHGAEVFELLGESCVAEGVPAESLATVGVEMRIAELPRRADETGTRLAAIVIDGFTSEIPTSRLYDRELDAECEVSDVGGELVCAPVEALSVVDLFADAACNIPIAVAFVPTGQCQPRFAYAGGRRIEGVYTAPIYELTTGDRCSPYAPPPRFAVHALGAPATDLVRATRVE